MKNRPRNFVYKKDAPFVRADPFFRGDKRTFIPESLRERASKNKGEVNEQCDRVSSKQEN